MADVEIGARYTLRDPERRLARYLAERRHEARRSAYAATQQDLTTVEEWRRVREC